VHDYLLGAATVVFLLADVFDAAIRLGCPLRELIHQAQDNVLGAPWVVAGAVRLLNKEEPVPAELVAIAGDERRLDDQRYSSFLVLLRNIPCDPAWRRIASSSGVSGSPPNAIVAAALAARNCTGAKLLVDWSQLPDHVSLTLELPNIDPIKIVVEVWSNFFPASRPFKDVTLSRYLYYILAATDDLHLDVRPIKPIAIMPGVDLVIVAGDTCEGALRAFEHLRRIVPMHIPIVMVMGNHEYYRRFVPHEVALARSQAPVFNIYLLENDTVVLGGIRFVGATFWTDYRAFGESNVAAVMNACATGMNDHRLIGWQKEPWLRLRCSTTMPLDARRWQQRKN
jgi:hypothetical protein